MAMFQDCTGEWVEVNFRPKTKFGNAISFASIDEDEFAYLLFIPDTARQIAAALIEAADKAEAGQ